MALEQPKKPVGGAYGAFLAEKRPEFAKATAGKQASAVSKLAGEQWKKLSDAEKAPYQKRFEEAKAQYDNDMKAFLAAGGTKALGARAQATQKRKLKDGDGGKGKRGKAADPNKPKKPAGGAYGCFLSKHRPDFQKQTAGQGVTAVAKLASAKWKAMSEADKKPYETEYQAKKAAYDEAVKAYKESGGATAAAANDEEGEDAEEDAEDDAEDDAEEEE